MRGTLIARASDLVQDAATWTGTPLDSRYPVTNVNDRRAHTVVRSTGSSLTLTATFPSAGTLRAVAVIHTNATAIQVTSGGGLNVALPIPAMPLDALPLDPWLDLTGLSGVTASTWSFALTGPSGVACTEILLVQTLRPIDFLVGTVTYGDAHPAIRHETDGGVSWRYSRGYRRRSVTGNVVKKAFEADVLALGRDLRGELRGALLILDSGINDAQYVELLNDREFQWGFPHSTDVQLEFQELGKGLAL